MAESTVGYAGRVNIKKNGEIFSAHGNFTFRVGTRKTEMVDDFNSVRGGKVIAQSSMIEGMIKISDRLDISRFIQNEPGTVIELELTRGDTWSMIEAIYTEEGIVETEEGTLKIKFESSNDLQQIGAPRNAF